MRVEDMSVSDLWEIMKEEGVPYLSGNSFKLWMLVKVFGMTPKEAVNNCYMAYETARTHTKNICPGKFDKKSEL